MGSPYPSLCIFLDNLFASHRVPYEIDGDVTYNPAVDPAVNAYSQLGAVTGQWAGAKAFPVLGYDCFVAVTVPAPNEQPGTSLLAVWVDIEGGGNGESAPINWAQFDGQDWHSNGPIPGCVSFMEYTALCLTSSGGTAYLAWNDATENSVSFASFVEQTGIDNYVYPGQGVWQSLSPIPAPLGTVSLQEFDGKVYAVWSGGPEIVNHLENVNGQEVMYPVPVHKMTNASFQNGEWTTHGNLPGLTSFGASLAVFNNRLYAAWNGAFDHQIWYASMDKDGNWSGESNIFDAETNQLAQGYGPGICTFGNNALYAVWQTEQSIIKFDYAYMDVSGGWHLFNKHLPTKLHP